MRSFLITCCALLLVLVSCNSKREFSSPHFSIQKLADGVWAAIHNDSTGHAICNAGIVDLGKETLVFDVFISPAAAEDLKKAAKHLTGRPVTKVVNSHYHDDHIRGNQVFAPGAEIISTVTTRNLISSEEPENIDHAKKVITDRVKTYKSKLDSAKGPEKKEALMWLNYYKAIEQSLPGLKTTLPTTVFTDSLRIRGSERDVLLLECRNAHTAGDAVMLVPGTGIIFLGDMFFTDRHPWLGDGDPQRWADFLQAFYDDGSLTQYVPGHGPVGGKPEIKTLIGYMGKMQQLAADALQKNIPDSVFTASPVLPEYADWWYGRFYPANLAHLYQKAK